MNKLTVCFDADGVILDSVPTIVQLHHELTGEIPKIHHSQSVSWNFQDTITADVDTINSYFEHPRFFELVPFISNGILSMKTFLKQLLSEQQIEVSFITKATNKNFLMKQNWLKERLPLFDINNMTQVDFDVIGKPNVNSTIFVDDCSINLNGNAKYNILFRKNGLITEYNKGILENTIVADSVTQLASEIFNILEFERIR